MKSSVDYARPVNGHRAKETTIGYVETTEPKEHRISYETASAYTLVSVPAGRYDVVLHEGIGIAWVLIRYHGIVTDDHYVNRLGASSSIAPKRGIGEERSCIAQTYPYSAAERFANDPTWTLAEDWQVRSEERESFCNPGEMRTHYRLVSPEGRDYL